MAWFADLAGKAENLLNNLDEQTGAALRSNGLSRRDSFENRNSSPKKQNHLLRKTLPNEIKSTSSSKRTLLNSKQYDNDSKKLIKSRTKRSTSPKRNTLDNCPETEVGDVHNEYYGLRQRRSSLPSDKELLPQNNQEYNMQKVRVENTMLKNELNVLHVEVSQLLERLGRVEDGNDVVSDQELSEATKKLETAASSHNNNIKSSLSKEFEELKLKVHELTVIEMQKQKQQCKDLTSEIDLMTNRNKELEDFVRQLIQEASEHEAQQIKSEKDLKHAQTVIAELESNLEKSTAECQRLESDWEGYKLRVKSMLFAKDKEIRQLQEGLNLTEDTKILIEQIDTLKEERDELAETVSTIRAECSASMRRVEELQSSQEAAERVVAALRDALKEERAAKMRAEAQAAALSKDLRNVQLETNETIVTLRTTLCEKDSEISLLKAMALNDSSSSAINVADYDEQASIDNDKIHYLTQTLVQRQGKIDSLLADNNMLRIQLEKLESKHQSELSALRAKTSHSIVQLQEDGRSRRGRHTGSFIGNLSQRLGPLFRYPVFRMFLLFYMLGLHFWVITVLLTSTPENTKSGIFKRNIQSAQPFQT